MLKNQKKSIILIPTRTQTAKIYFNRYVEKRCFGAGFVTELYLHLAGVLCGGWRVLTHHTDKKENQIFFIYKESQKWSSCKVIYEVGLPNTVYMRKCANI